MTGPEHYAEAERLLTDYGWDDPLQAAQAQVHATLAVAAAMIDVHQTDSIRYVAWVKAVQSKRADPVTY